MTTTYDERFAEAARRVVDAARLIAAPHTLDNRSLTHANALDLREALAELDAARAAAPTASTVEARRALALVAGIAVLAGPPRTRPLAGFLYGAFLSRVHGASRDRLAATIGRLFDDRQALTPRIDGIAGSLGDVTGRVADVELTAHTVAPHGVGEEPQDVLAARLEARRRVEARLAERFADPDLAQAYRDGRDR